MSVMLTEAVRPITITELAQASPEGAHGLAVLTATVNGDVLAVCSCSLAAYGIDVDHARTQLAEAHT